MSTNTRGRYAAPRKSRTPILAALLVVGLVAVGCSETAKGSSKGEAEPSGFTSTSVSDGSEPVTLQEKVEQTETVEVTPAVCIEALDAAESLTHDIVVPSLDVMASAMQAAADYDAAAIYDAADHLDVYTAEMGPIIDDYNAASAECRALTEG